MRHFTSFFVATALSAGIGVGAHAQTKMAIGYSASSSWTGAFIAADQGFFKQHGIDADLVFVAVSPSIPPALLAGSLQAGGLASPDLIHAVDGGIDLVVIGGALWNAGKTGAGATGAGVFARTGLDLKQPQDFVGKRVGVPGLGTALDIGFRKWLHDNNVDLKSVNFVEVPFPQGSDALRGGLVDAVVSNSPFTAHILDAKTGYLAADYLHEMEPAPQTLYVTTRDWALQHPDAVKGFKQALIEAIAFEAQNPDATRASIAKWTKLPPAAQAGIVLPNLKPEFDPSGLKFWTDAMIDQGLIKTSPDLSKLIVQ